MRPIDRMDDMSVYELGDAKSQDDWTNELNHQVENDKWKEYREAYDLLQSEQYQEALVKFSTFLDKHPYDIVAQRMIEQCHENMSTMSTRTETELDL